uniref:OrfA n=1 Tax=Stichodactyla haddoni TaxID=475174 RepID=A0A8F5V7U0_STIHA|nr:OrfA [Stichodactyla haddoni]
MFLTPPTGWFECKEGTFLDIPINFVWGPPLFYKGVIVGDPFNFVSDYKHPAALGLVKKMTETKIFQEMSLFQRKGEGQGDIGILKNYKTFLKNFIKKELSRSSTVPPFIKIPWKELFLGEYIQPITALKLWLWRGELYSSDTSYGYACKVLGLPKNQFIIRAFRRQIVRSNQISNVL